MPMPTKAGEKAIKMRTPITISRKALESILRIPKIRRFIWCCPVLSLRREEFYGAPKKDEICQDREKPNVSCEKLGFLRWVMSHSPLRVIVYLLPGQKLAKIERFVNLCWRQKKTPQSRNFRGGRLGALTNADDALWSKGPSQRRTALDLKKGAARSIISICLKGQSGDSWFLQFKYLNFG